MNLDRIELRIGIGLGIFTTIIVFKEDFFVGIISLAITVLLFFIFWKMSTWTPYLRLQKLNVSQFVRNIPLQDIVSIKVICHTGKYAYIELQERLEELKNENARKAIKVTVLARYPLAESSDRASDIIHTHEKVQAFKRKHFNIDIRYYQSLPVHRAVICQYKNGNRKTYISNYEWIDAKSKVSEYAFIVRDSIKSPHKLVKSVDSWINHYWGNGIIHTLVFDFDDTLALTRELQIDAWIEAIKNALTSSTIHVNEFSQELKEVHENPQKYRDTFKKIFLEHEMAEQIMDAVLPTATSIVKTKIEKTRNQLRKRNLETSGMLFSGVREKLNALSKNYQLTIVTATYSKNVRDFLDAMKVLDKFEVVLGKEDLKYQWENVYNKSAQLLEISGLTGIPLNRLVFIGDNTSDYLAAKQIGVTFIEATQAADILGQNSLIKASALDSSMLHKRFNTYNDNSLDLTLQEIEHEKMQSTLDLIIGL